MSPETGLALAKTATHVPLRGLLDDTYTTGRLVKSQKRIKLRSLSPLINQHVWDEYIPLCPLLAFIRYAYNPIVESTGSAGLKMQYADSPKFLFCIFLEWMNYEYLYSSSIILCYHYYYCIFVFICGILYFYGWIFSVCHSCQSPTLMVISVLLLTCDRLIISQRL